MEQFMDTASPDPDAANAASGKAGRAGPSSRAVEYCVAAALILLALAVSPIAIRLFTGRPELTFRPLLLSAVFDLFLLLSAAAVLTRGRLRRGFFYLIAWVAPFALLAGLET